jgi:uncharacterized membrane protein YkoI
MIKKMLMLFAIVALSDALSCAGGNHVFAGEWQEDFNLAGRKLTHTGESEYFVLMPGFQTVLESGKGKLTITVLDETKKINGIITRVVEERELQKGRLSEVSRNFLAMDPKTGDVFYFGEEVDIYVKGKVAHHSGTWKAYENRNKPGLIMPGKPEVGMKYYQEQSPGIAMDRAEVISISETVKTPAGKFKNCLKTRESSKIEGVDHEYKTYAPRIGLVEKQDLKLIRYGYLRGKDTSSLGKFHMSENKPQSDPPVAKISREKATEIALKKVPGNVTSVSIEKKRGKKVYVVEIIEKSSGGEVDVLVDMESGKVLGTER